MFSWLFKKTECQELGHFWKDLAGDGNWTEYNDHPGGPPGNDMLRVDYHMSARHCLRCGLVDTVTTSENG